MKIDIDGMKVAVLGDPHLGRVFKNGVPLHRRGEREKMQWAEFERHLFDVEGCDYHVCVGDLFNSFLVPPEVILRAAQIYERAALDNPDVTYVVLRGNHDGSRDADRRSAFDVFEYMVGNNVVVVVDEPVVMDGMAFVPWHPFMTAEEMMAEANQVGATYKAVFGHWDIESYGSDNPMEMPLRELLGWTDLVVTGHVHAPRKFAISAHDQSVCPFGEGALDVIVTGSMLPYAHGEDPDGKLYRTLTVAEVTEALEQDPDAFKDVCLRILVEEGEEVQHDIDCLQLTTKRVQKGAEEEDIEVSLGDFDLKGIFDQVMDEHDLPEDMREQLWKRLREREEA